MGNTEQVDFPRKFHIAFLAFRGLLDPAQRLTSLKLGRGAIGSLLPSISEGEGFLSHTCAAFAFLQLWSRAHQVPRRHQSILLTVDCDSLDQLPSLPP